MRWAGRQPATTVLVCCTLVLGGCGGMSRNDAPAAVEERATPRDVVVSSTHEAPAPAAKVPEIAAYRPPAAPQYRRPEPNRAVATLMRRADDQQSAGDFGAAAVSLERALRIAPDDAALWSRLAALRLEQREYASVQQLAAKSNALAAPQDTELKARNWRLIADARRALGDDAGARSADQHAAGFER
jgi:tetratricopeptide (TPR) repeat protein